MSLIVHCLGAATPMPCHPNGVGGRGVGMLPRAISAPLQAEQLSWMRHFGLRSIPGPKRSWPTASRGSSWNGMPHNAPLPSQGAKIHVKGRQAVTQHAYYSKNTRHPRARGVFAQKYAAALKSSVPHAVFACDSACTGVECTRSEPGVCCARTAPQEPVSPGSRGSVGG